MRLHCTWSHIICYLTPVTICRLSHEFTAHSVEYIVSKALLRARTLEADGYEAVFIQWHLELPKNSKQTWLRCHIQYVDHSSHLTMNRLAAQKIAVCLSFLVSHNKAMSKSMAPFLFYHRKHRRSVQWIGLSIQSSGKKKLSFFELRSHIIECLKKERVTEKQLHDINECWIFSLAQPPPLPAFPGFFSDLVFLRMPWFFLRGVEFYLFIFLVLGGLHG